MVNTQEKEDVINLLKENKEIDSLEFVEAFYEKKVSLEDAENLLIQGRQGDSESEAKLTQGFMWVIPSVYLHLEDRKGLSLSDFYLSTMDSALSTIMLFLRKNSKKEISSLESEMRNEICKSFDSSDDRTFSDISQLEEKIEEKINDGTITFGLQK